MTGYPAPLPFPTTAPQRGTSARVRIVTDSASDILPRHAQALGVLVVPNRVILDGRILRDGIDITAAQFYAHMARRHQTRNAATTEPAEPAEFYQAYQTAFSQGATAIASIHVSSHFSQVVSHATAARDYLNPAPIDDVNVIDVIDSLQVGIGMWPAVIEAAHLASLGASLRDIHQRVVALLARTHVLVLVESLEPLRRSGRIGRIQGAVGSLIDAHPILTFEYGQARLVETVRSRRRAVVRMGELARALAPTDATVETLLVCGASIESIAEMEALLAQQYAVPIQKTWLGPTIGANIGPAIALALVVRD